jgi:hypothetical protein
MVETQREYRWGKSIAAKTRSDAIFITKSINDSPDLNQKSIRPTRVDRFCRLPTYHNFHHMKTVMNNLSEIAKAGSKVKPAIGGTAIPDELHGFINPRVLRQMPAGCLLETAH